MSANLFIPESIPTRGSSSKTSAGTEMSTSQSFLPKNSKTIIEEPTLEIQEADHEAAIRDSGHLTIGLTSTSELEDKIRHRLTTRLHLQSGKSLPSAKEGATPAIRKSDPNSSLAGLKKVHR